MNKMIFILAIVILLFVSLSSSFGTTPSFHGLGDLPGGSYISYALDVSDKGPIVVGQSRSDSGPEAFCWTAHAGINGLGFRTAEAVSSDGSIVVGWPTPLLWTLDGGIVDLPFSGEPSDISADGSVVVGWSSSQAFRWTADTGMVYLGDLPGGRINSGATAVSSDGSTVVGSSWSASGREAFRWTADSGMIGLGDLEGGIFYSSAAGVSGDGSIVVGTSLSDSGRQAFRWTAESGMIGLGYLPGGDLDTSSDDISADGSIVVGRARDRAFLWTAERGMVNLQEMLEEEYGLDLTGWKLEAAIAISEDGSWIVGFGRKPEGYLESWIVMFDEPEIVIPVGLEITGHERVRENYQTQYKAIAYYEDGRIRGDATDLAVWSVEQEAIASIENGLLSTEDINQPEDITISAQYTYGGVTVEANMAVEVLVPPYIWRVPSDHETIQAAIDYSIDGEEVAVADGTYTGEGNRDITFRGKAITVRSENGPENCIVDGNNEFCRGFYFHGGEDANSVLDGFTITNCTISGILCFSSPMINNCIITGNSGYGGGGIRCLHGDPAINNCIISGNTVRMGDGGGIYCGFGSPTITNCTISGNTAKYGGGGISCYVEGSPTLINCTISGNRATWDHGGGIYCQRDSTLTLTNCTIAGNTAEDEGGGIYFKNSSSLTMNHCTVAGNVAENIGGGILCGDDSVFRLANCILWGNSDSSGTGQLAQIQGGRPDVIYSCIQDDDANDMDIPFGDANGNIDDRPMFVREPDDGGDGWWDDPCTPGVDEGANNNLGDVHLRIVSPCIDSGLPNFVAGPNTFDMDGQPRVMGLDIDMGADEYEKFIIVTEPVGGEVWAAGSTHEVEWSSYGAGQVDIMLSKNSGGSWQSIKEGISDTGGYSWHILNKYCSEEAQVKVVPSEADANVICIESGVFEIVPYDGPASVPRRKKEPKYKPVEKYGPEFGCVKWKFETDGPVTAGVTIGREIDRQRKVYAACEDGKLYALDLETGSLVWSYDVNSALVGSAAEGLQGCVYVGGRDGRLYAIDKEGLLLWTHTTDAPIYSSAVVSPQEQIYVCSEDGMLYALKRNGSEVWRYETSGFAKLGGSIFATLQIGSDGTVYIAGLYDPNLYALNPKDGSVKWRCNFAPPHDPCAPSSGGRRSGWPFAPPAIAPDGTIYQTLLYDPNLYAVEPETGTIIWSTDLAGTLMWYKNFIEYPWWYTKEIFIWYGSGDPPEYVEGHELYLIGRHKHAPSWTSPALGPDGTIYVSFDDPYLRAVDPDGDVKWATRLGMVGGLTVTVGDDGLVYAASYDNKLYVVEPTGEEVARFEGEGWLSHPTIAPGHTIIVSDANNTVWAITQEDCGNKPPVLDVPPDGNGP